MKHTLICLMAVAGMATAGLTAQAATPLEPQTHTLQPIKLNAPNLKRGESIMQALSKRQSIRTYANKELSTQDLSDLVWAANGINRPESGKRTAPSAMNKQDVKVYVCTVKGSYLYNPQQRTLDPLTAGDARPTQQAPVVLVLVTDTNESWAPLDAGIVSQNISLFCAGTGLGTYARGTMDRNKLKTALKLTGTQTIMLCHPVGYVK